MFLLQHAACSMQHDSRTALQFVHAIGKSTTDHTLPYIQRVMWTVYPHLHCNYWACGLCSWSLLQCTAQLIVLSTSHCAVSLGIYHGWWPTLACVLTATLKSLPWEGLLSCCTDDALSYLNHSVPLVIPILKIIFRLVQSLSPPNMLLYYGGTMVELHRVLLVANFHHDLLAGTLKQH